MDEQGKNKLWLVNNPTAEQRAVLIVKRLESFIREGRSDDSGISFKRWQEMAVNEFTNGIRDAERILSQDSWFLTKILAVGASAIITIGFWGIVVTTEVFYGRQVTAFILVGAGGALFLILALWGVRRLSRRLRAERRKDRIQRVIDFDSQLRQLDKENQKRLENSYNSSVN